MNCSFYDPFNVNKEKQIAPHRFLSVWLVLNIYLKIINHALNFKVHTL